MLNHLPFAFLCIYKTFRTLKLTVIFAFQLHKMLLFRSPAVICRLFYTNLISCRKGKPSAGNFLKPLVHVIDRLARVVVHNNFGKKLLLFRRKKRRQNNTKTHHHALNLRQGQIRHLGSHVVHKFPISHNHLLSVNGSVFCISAGQVFGKNLMHPLGRLTFSGKTGFIIRRIVKIRSRLIFKKFLYGSKFCNAQIHVFMTGISRIFLLPKRIFDSGRRFKRADWSIGHSRSGRILSFRQQGCNCRV